MRRAGTSDNQASSLLLLFRIFSRPIGLTALEERDHGGWRYATLPAGTGDIDRLFHLYTVRQCIGEYIITIRESLVEFIFRPVTAAMHLEDQSVTGKLHPCSGKSIKPTICCSLKIKCAGALSPLTSKVVGQEAFAYLLMMLSFSFRFWEIRTEEFEPANEFDKISAQLSYGHSSR